MTADTEVEIRQTDDGSATLYSSRYEQSYHNPGGAVSESRHVFFRQTGLLEALEHEASISVLEVGFGTGLNLLLLLDYYLNSEGMQNLQYTGIERAPISAGLFRSLDFGEQLEHPRLVEPIGELLENTEEGFNSFRPVQSAECSLFVGEFREFPERRVQADYIFHDAFSPDVNPELWSGEAFRKLRGNSARHAVLSTYSSASRARGAMSWAGWTVARTEGALGKREMSIASPDSDVIRQLDLTPDNNERLARRYEIGDFD